MDDILWLGDKQHTVTPSVLFEEGRYVISVEVDGQDVSLCMTPETWEAVTEFRAEPEETGRPLMEVLAGVEFDDE